MSYYCGILCMKRYQFLRDCIKTMKKSALFKVYAVPMDTEAFAIATKESKDLTGVLYQHPAKTLHGNQRQFIETIIRMYPDDKDAVFILSADDYKYHPEWQNKLLRFMSNNPEQISHLSGDLEPVFPWNTIRGSIEHNGVTGLIRNTICGANMIFTRQRWNEIADLWKSQEHDWMFDHRLCKYASDTNQKCIGLNLAEHLGTKNNSSLGNNSWSRPDCLPLPAEYQNI